MDWLSSKEKLKSLMAKSTWECWSCGMSHRNEAQAVLCCFPEGRIDNE